MNARFSTLGTMLFALLISIPASLAPSQVKNSSQPRQQEEKKVYFDTQEREKCTAQNHQVSTNSLSSVHSSGSSSSCSSPACPSTSRTITDADKLCDLGNALKNDGKQFFPTALRCYEQAAKDPNPKSIRGRARALCNLGFCHENGHGVEVNQKVALAHFHASAEVDKTFAWPLYKLFDCYYYGKGTSTNQPKAFEYLKKAAALGHPDALYELGVQWQNGTFGKVDMREAVRCYQAATTDNTNPHLGALYNLAFCYQEGWGVAVDQKRAAALYHLAAEKGLPDAMRNFACCFLYGIGVNKNLRQAFQKFKEAAIAGDPYAQLVVARAYQRGIMVKKDAEKEAAWLSTYEKTANKAHTEALRELNTNASFFTAGIEIDIAGDVCPICQDETRRFAQADEIRILSCLHVVCQDCLERWYPGHHTCPICRTAQRCVTGTVL